MDLKSKIEAFKNGKLALKVEPHDEENIKLKWFIKRAFPKGKVVPSSRSNKVYYIEANMENNNGALSVFYCWNDVLETKLQTITIDEFKMDSFHWFLDEYGRQIVIND